MIRLRSLLYLCIMAVTVILYSIPIAVLGWFMPLQWGGRISSSWARVNLVALESICGLGYRVTGIDNLPSGAYIVLSKHQSAWETIALRALLPPEHVWVLKRELMWVPFFGWALAALKPIAIDRQSVRRSIKQLQKQGLAALSAGRPIVIFPEGTRVAPGTHGKYGVGGAMLAAKSGVPLVPVAHNAGVFWRRRDINKYPGTIDLVVGTPIPTHGLSASAINEKVEDWIETTVASLPSRHG